MAHQKHVKLKKANFNAWHRCEWAIYGTVCADIEKIVKEIATILHPIKIGYLDESHDKNTVSPLSLSITQSDSLANTSKNSSIDYHEIQRILIDVDILLINGNHHKASRQIVFQDERKRESLSKKLDRLTQIDLIINPQEGQRFPFLDALISRDQPDVIDAPMYILAENLRKKWLDSIPEIKGLVLAGGESTRMGEDKGLLNYHGMSQRDYLLEIIENLKIPSYLSLRSKDTAANHLKVIEDTFQGLGPLGGILSAFQTYPDHAWLTVACDLPYLSKQSIDQLIKERDPSKIATCFHNPETSFPEPLITIWEPRAYQKLLMFMAQGYACPRKVLINSDVKEVKINNILEITNVNTPEEREKVKKHL